MYTLTHFTKFIVSSTTDILQSYVALDITGFKPIHMYNLYGTDLKMISFEKKEQSNLQNNKIDNEEET